MQKKNIRFRFDFNYQMTGGTHKITHYLEGPSEPDHTETTWKELYFIFIFSDTFFHFEIFFTLANKNPWCKKVKESLSVLFTFHLSFFFSPVSKERKQTKNNIKRSNFSLIRNRRNLDFLLHFFFIFLNNNFSYIFSKKSTVNILYSTVKSILTVVAKWESTSESFVHQHIECIC